jgi:hypothetical protein
MSNTTDSPSKLDAETLSVLATLVIDIGISMFIFFGFLLYRKLRGDNLRER